ncbi:MAG TPA: winged helix-turn-helix domain-containing protein [Candidatus Aquilonibacter sp.]|nr:winged helix-turn-helix domain-containing protein [Candidatus Aquilonibacter sp.]
MSNAVNGLYQFGEFRLDARKRTLHYAEELVTLTPKAFETLLVLIESPGHVVAKDELMKAVWPDSFVEESNLTQTIFMLRKALGQTRDQGYIVTVPGRGYRFVADVRPVERTAQLDAHPSAASAASESLPRRQEGRRHRVPMFVGVAAVLLLASAGYLSWIRPRPISAGRTMLAVLPFENLTGDPRQEYFSDGMTEEMISQLGNLDPQHLAVIARTSVMFYKSNPKSLDQVGHELGVQYVLEGSVRREGQRLRITAQLIQLKDQTHLWARNYDRSANDLLAVQQEITQEIADELKLTFDGRRIGNLAAHRAAAPQNTSYEAYDVYLKGRYFLSKRSSEGFQQAADYFQQAIAQDSSYARAYAGLADTYALMSTWGQAPSNQFMPKARAAALRALALNESLAEAHASLALIAENYDYDWQTAEKEYRRAIQLDPGYATGHQWYAEYLSWQGRFDEALAESGRARQLDPLSLIIATDHASILYFARHYDRAILQCRTVLDMDPNFLRARGILIHSYVQTGRFPEALHEVEQWTNEPYAIWEWGWKAYVYGRWGRTAEAERALAKFEQLLSHYPNDPKGGLLLAYLGTGRRDQSIRLLQQLYLEHSPVVATLKTDPMYDPVRGDPRFQQLVARVVNGARSN